MLFLQHICVVDPEKRIGQVSIEVEVVATRGLDLSDGAMIRLIGAGLRGRHLVDDSGIGTKTGTKTGQVPYW